MDQVICIVRSVARCVRKWNVVGSVETNSIQHRALKHTHTHLKWMKNKNNRAKRSKWSLLLCNNAGWLNAFLLFFSLHLFIYFSFKNIALLACGFVVFSCNCKWLCRSSSLSFLLLFFSFYSVYCTNNYQFIINLFDRDIKTLANEWETIWKREQRDPKSSS